MKKTDFQLEHYTLEKMHADWIAPTSDTATNIEQIESSFSCHVLRHNKLPRQFKVVFEGRFFQRTAAGALLGFQVEAKVVALVTVSDAVPEGKLQSFVHGNAVNVLYGTLRGLVASATGVFPYGPLILPSISANEILASIQAQPAKTPAIEHLKARLRARKSISPKSVPRATQK